MGRREARGLGFPQRGGWKQPSFTDPCCHPLGWRNRSVAAFRRTPAPPRWGLGVGKSQSPEGTGQPLPTAPPAPSGGSSSLPETSLPQKPPRAFRPLLRSMTHCFYSHPSLDYSLRSDPIGLSSHQRSWAPSNCQIQLTPTYPYLKSLPRIQTPETKNESLDVLDHINIKGICMAKRCPKQK